MNKEYNNLLSELYSKDDENIYQSLMQKEDKVISMINRVSTQERDKNQDKGDFLHMPIIALFRTFTYSIKGAFEDLLKAKNIKHVKRAILKDERMMYIGLLLILIALFLLLIQGE